MKKVKESNVLLKYVNEKANGTIETLLPFVHTCKATDAEKSIYNNSLVTTECDVFKKKNFYMFLGKPAYVIEPNMEKSHPDASKCPVCFILKPDLEESVERIYPFDSGAYHEGLYAKFDDTFNDVDMETYRLSDFKSVRNYIEIFFGSYNAYWECKPVIDETNISVIDLFLRLLSANSTTDTDQRCGVVELINDKNIKISKYVEAVILPRSLMQKEDPKTHRILGDILKNNKICAIPYTTLSKTKPVYYVAQIIALMEQYLMERGLLNEW